MNSIIDFNFMHILLAVFVVIFVSVLARLVIATVKTLKGRTKYTFFILLSVFSVLIAGVSWVLNMGWLRFFMTFLLVPFIHAFLVYIISLLSVKYYDRVAKLKLLNMIFLASYLFAYMFFPDGGDYGPMYCFFGLIKNDIFVTIAYYVSVAALMLHIVMFILIVVKMVKSRTCKNNPTNNQESEAKNETT